MGKIQISNITHLNIGLIFIMLTACTRLITKVDNIFRIAESSNGIKDIDSNLFTVKINISGDTFEIINYPFFIALAILIFNLLILFCNSIKGKNSEKTTQNG